jgi:cysteine-rich repeat protein
MAGTNPSRTHARTHATLTAIAICVAVVGSAPATKAAAQTFPITFDATALGANCFNIDGGTFGGGQPAVVTILNLPPGSHSFDSPCSNPNTEFFFTVTSSGTLDFAPALDAYVGGRGTNRLTVSGLPIIFDATALSPNCFNLAYGAGGGPTTVLATLRVLAGTYEFDCPCAHPGTSFLFTVSTTGMLDFAAALDPYVSGRGTSTLTVMGYPIVFDATALSPPIFNLSHGAASGGHNTAVVTTLHLIPGDYTFDAPFSNPSTSFPFIVDTTGKVDFDPALNGQPCGGNGYVCGRGTSTLTVLGFPVIFDLTGLAAPNFDVNNGAGGGGSTCAPVTLTLVPGTSDLNIPASSAPPMTAFTVTSAGTFDYVCDPMLHTCQESCLSGRGTSQLRVTCGAAALCGDGVVNACEQCDPATSPTGCSGGQTCTSSCTCQAAPDADGDGVPNGSDQCPGTPPGQVVDSAGCSCGQKDCSDTNVCTTDSCNTSNAQCGHTPIPNCPPTGCGNGVVTSSEACDDRNAADGDGCSVLCQIEDGWACAGQPSICSPICGDGKVRGSEKCDLGSENGQPGSGCTSDCRLRGSCTRSGTVCALASECPLGQGCCGNSITEIGEACDDGNAVDLDCCSSQCKVEPPETCEPQACNVFGPHLVPLTTRRTTFTDGDRSGVSERWTTRGEFLLNAGQRIDPDTDAVELLVSEGTATRYKATLEPAGCAPLTSCFVQKGLDTCTKSWKFTDKQADVVKAIGWKTGTFKQRKVTGGVCGNKVTFTLASGKNATVTNPAGTRIRESIRIGDDCASALLTCTTSVSGKVRKCASTSP